MFIKIWNFIAGYVKIEIAGFSVERFVSRAVDAGLTLRDLRRDGGKFYTTLSREDFLQALQLAEKTGTRVLPASFHGLPVIVAGLKKRPLLPIGALVFAAFMLVITSFIWRIDIEGAERVKPAEILTFLEGKGFAAGHTRHGISYREIENLILLEFDDIAWVSLSITGTRALIQVVETIQHSPITHQFEGLDIVAAKDGVVVHMATAAGTPLFAPGDVVAAGETIVTGRLNIETAEEGLIATRYIQADAQVWARVYYTMQFNIPLTYFEKSFTGQHKKVYSINMGGREFVLPHAPHNFVYYEAVENHRQMAFGRNLPMPLATTVTTNYELTRNLRSRSPEAAQEMAQELAARRILEELGEDADIIEKQISFTQNYRDMAVEVFLTVIERIDKIQELIPEADLQP
ncbi:MAG: sporulation protein YqfD [Defluviitaleaceae bacterium]|nr:sporulation protein YqfD [Defluviitaleaceae bacterium]